MALTNSNTFDIKGGVELATSYFRISKINVAHTGTIITSELLVYKDEASYNAAPYNNIAVIFDTRLKLDYDRAINGEDVLLFVHQSWLTQLYSLFPTWGDSGLTIVNLEIPSGS